MMSFRTHRRTAGRREVREVGGDRRLREPDLVNAAEGPVGSFVWRYLIVAMPRGGRSRADGES